MMGNLRVYFSLSSGANSMTFELCTITIFEFTQCKIQDLDPAVIPAI